MLNVKQQETMHVTPDVNVIINLFMTFFCSKLSIGTDIYVVIYSLLHSVYKSH